METFQSFEAARSAYAKKLKPLIITGSLVLFFAIIAIIFSIIFLTDQSYFQIVSVISIAIFVIVVTSVCIALVYTLSVRKHAITYKKLYKAYFIQRSLQQTFTNLHYSHEAGMPKATLDATNMINTGDRYSSNDFVSGKYKDVEFSQADVKIEEEHEDSDGNSTYVTIFKGRYMIFKFPKAFNFRLQIVQKWFGASKHASQGPSGQKISRISTESITFDKKFKVYAEDGFEAYYILDPAFIDRIETLSASRNGKLLLGFVDNNLHVAINDKQDAFEPPNPLKPIDAEAEFAKVQQDIKTITDFVDFLQLDRKLFKK